jgi:hypothetical protein
MKRIGYLYDNICDIKNIKLAIMKSSSGKRDKKFVKKVIKNIDFYSKEVQKLLINKSYKASPYTVKTILDGANKKERTIYKPRYFPDQIIHWSLMLQLHDIILKGMYEYNCGSVPGRGTSYGQKILRKWIDRDYRGTKYCLKMDISKFYNSVDNKILKQMFREKIKDANCLWLIDEIINSNEGLPIGNYTSQWFSNFFMQGFDHYIKEKLKVDYYIRYVDDLVILGGNKRELHKVRKSIDKYLRTVNLKLKNNWQISLINDRAIDFLGLRFFRKKTILRKRNSLRIKRRMTKIKNKEIISHKDACAVVSYWGWIKRSNSYNFYNKYIKPVISIFQARKVISDCAKIRNN